MTLPLSANISFMFLERPFLERIDAAARTGFPAVECHFPYEFAIPELKQRLAGAGIRLTGINTAPGDLAAGDWGLACDPSKRDAFKAGVMQALDYAVALDVPNIHVMAGMTGALGHAVARESYTEAMAFAAEEGRKAGRTILTEPLNTRDKPGYFISRSDEVASLIREIGHPSLKLMFDCYHVQIMEGDVSKRLEKHRSIIGHVQIAAVPSRHEPDEGELDHRHLLKALEAVGYDGYVGCEYKPRGRTEDGLGWIKAVMGA
jgi:2-dehydrotetronate isomerase